MFAVSKKTISLSIIMMIAFIDWMGVGLVYPMFSSMLFQGDCALISPDAGDTFRGACLGILLATMPITQFFAAPVLGTLSDQIGRKKVLIPALALGVAGYIIAGLGVYLESLAVLLLSRVFIGISGGTATLVGACIADVSSSEEKAKHFGLSNMAGGLGFTVGPFLGGWLSSSSFLFEQGYMLPFAAAGFALLINFLLAIYFFEETFKPRQQGKVSFSQGFQNILRACSLKSLQAVFLAVFLACVGWSFYWEFMPVTWISRYGFSTAMIGNFYAYGAAVYALSCGLLIRPIVDRFSNQHVLCFSLFGCAFSIAMLLVSENDLWLWFYIPLQQFSIALFWPTASAVISNAVSENIQGEILGVLQSVDSLAFAISPLLAGPLLGISISMPIFIGSISMLLAGGVLAASLFKEKTASLLDE